MKKYEKPVVLANKEMSEGVYAASGDCYTVTGNIHQTPQEGRGDYRVQLNATHAAEHHSTAQTVKVVFNLPVKYKSCSNAVACSGDGTNTLVIEFNYHNNASEYIGLGELVVEADAGLAITSTTSVYCNESCAQHP